MYYNDKEKKKKTTKKKKQNAEAFWVEVKVIIKIIVEKGKVKGRGGELSSFDYFVSSFAKH